MPKIRNIIIFIAIAATFVLIYIFFIKPSSDEQANLISSGTSSTLPDMNGSANSVGLTDTNSFVAGDFLILFSGVKNIKLNDAIFSDPAFDSLHDSSIVLIPDGTEGRPNPFAQFGNDGVITIPSL
ncbi:hypothetical protein KKG24_02575 [Patescibacteria group bacterium]|nr:hypothetical protein [Patescibacteria group bacterium]